MNFVTQVKGLTKDALIYGLGGALGRFLGIITAPILTRIFIPSDYGVIALLQTMVGMLTLLAGFNLNSGVYFYYFSCDLPKDKKVIVSSSLIFHLFFGLTFSLAAWVGAPLLEKFLLIRQSGIESVLDYDYSKYVQILAIGIFFSIMDTNFRSLLRMTRQPLKYMFLNILHLIVNLGLIILFVVYLQWDIEGALWAGVIANIIVSIVGFALVFKHFAAVFSFSFLTLFLAYCMPQFPSVILNLGLFQSNRFFINYFSPLVEQGYFAIALKVASIILLFTTAFRLAWDPFALSIMKEKDAATTYSRGFTMYMVGLGSFGGCVALFAKPALVAIAPESYHVAYSYVFILIFAFICQGGNNILGIGIWISKKTKFTSYAQLITFAVNVILNFILIPRFHALGAAIAFMIGISTQTLAYYYFSQRLFPIPYRFWRIHMLLLAMFSIVGIETLLIKDLNLLGSFILAVLFCPVLAIMAWKVGLSRGERRQIIEAGYAVLFKRKLRQSTT